MKDPLPVPDQLEKQLSKCKSIRDADSYYKSREKTPQVRSFRCWDIAMFVLGTALTIVSSLFCRFYSFFMGFNLSAVGLAY
ncbi:hypothetical protein HJC23_002372 [Cyclotella cryptica]|uniref:Uncharacterized protein n=1 Tax=Cyclotella cryptica TaxID=29204 RepID=A0ABD3QLK0_9STRA